jgi:hypothetical protein
MLCRDTLKVVKEREEIVVSSAIAGEASSLYVDETRGPVE